MTLKRIAITGAAGQIAYALSFRIASGELFGSHQKVALHLLDLPPCENALRGVEMELQDCAFPLLKEVKIGSIPEEVFAGVDYAILVGAKPRGPGMERKDLLAENGKIFVEQAQALNRVANKGVRTLVVGNPCNTNCLIAMHHAPNLPKSHFHAMTRLDQNRAAFQLAQKANVEIQEVTHVTIWGNHSSTQVPDFVNARIHGTSAARLLDRKWLETEFISCVQKRGAAIIEARGKSSAASATQAILDAMRSFLQPTPHGQWFSSAVDSTGNPYGIEEGLVFSFPCRSKGMGDFEIVKALEIDSFLQEKLKITQKELVEERDLVSHLLK